MGGRGCTGWSGVKGRKWDNCNSIINKIYFKKVTGLIVLTHLKKEVEGRKIISFYPSEFLAEMPCNREINKRKINRSLLTCVP